MLMIVSREDFPVYELPIEKLIRQKEGSEDKAHLYEMVLHAALDPIDIIQWQTPSMYLKQVDRFDNLNIHCLITPSNAKLLLLHETETEEKIK
jgi:trafficking protein particle complex subunit 2